MSDIKSSNMLITANGYIEKLSKFAEATALEFDDYQKSCVMNAVRAINPMIEGQGLSWSDFKVDNIVTVLQQAAFLRVNPSAVPRECYYIVRKTWNKKTSSYDITLEFGVEGAGNDVILKRYGRDVSEFKSYIVYKDDKFTAGHMDGWDMILPKYERTFKTNVPEKVVYLIKKKNGEIDVQYADLNDVKKSLLASARQNGADENLIRELDKEDLYHILNNQKWLDYKIKKEYGKNTYESPLFNPSYTSPVSQYNMIERKLRNHATRKYPKNFDSKEIAQLYEETFEDRIENIPHVETVTPEERIKKANKDVEEKAGQTTLKDDDREELEEIVEEENVVEETVEETEEQDVEEKEYEVTDPDNGVVEEVERETEPEKEKIGKPSGNWFD